MRRIFRFLSSIVAVVLLLGVPALLIYLQFFGFSAKWRAEVAKALSGPAYTVEIGRLTFNPFEGIVAEDAQLFRRDSSRRRLAGIDRLTVSPNLAQLLRGKVSIDQFDLENTTASIPFANDGVKPDTIELHGIRASILNANGQLTITEAECWRGDLHLVVRGHLLNPEIAQVKRPPASVDDTRKRVEAVRSILRILDRIRFEGESPELSLSIHGDLLHPESITADQIELRTGRVGFEGLRFDRLSLEASLENRVLRVKSLRGNGLDGDILIAGRWDFLSNSGSLDVTGALRWAPLLVLAGREDLARQITFEKPPALQASITAVQSGKSLEVAATGRVSSGAFVLKGLKGKSFEASAAWKDGRLYVQDAVLHAQTGVVRADVLTGSGEFHLRLASDAKPGEFLDFFGPKERQIVELLEFEDTPRLRVRLDGTRPSLDALSGTGTIVLGRSAMRGSWIDSATSDLVFQDRAILYKNLVIAKGRQRATGSFTYDFGKQQVRLDGVRSNLNPPDVLMWVDPRIAATVSSYRFRSPPDVRADGVTHMKDPTRNDLHVSVDAPGGMIYSLLNKDLVFGHTRGTVDIVGQRVIADVSEATLYGGDVAVKANVSINPQDPTFRVQTSVRRVDFPSLTNLYFGYAKSKGVMSGDYSFSADLKKPADMRGRGDIRVEEGHVMAIPLFGPLSEIISAVIPGAGHESARVAKMDFEISERRVRTSNLEIQGAGFELFGDGSVGFPSGDLDLTVRINARGLPGIVLFPVSKLLEYVSTGTMADPRWRPKIIPREFFDVLGMGGSPETEAAPPASTPQSPAATPAPRKLPQAWPGR